MQASKTATQLKSGYFTAFTICSFSAKTVRDRHRYTAYHNKH